MFELTQGRLNCGFPFYHARDIDTNKKVKVDQHYLDHNETWKRLSKTAKLLYGAKLCTK